MSMKTIEQERASFCIQYIRDEIKKLKKAEITSYKRAAKNLPAFIVSNGLIPTLAFYKSKNERKAVYDTINEWLKRKFIKEDSLTELVNTDFQTLRLATVEVLALANWLKRIVEVEIEDEEEEI